MQSCDNDDGPTTPNVNTTVLTASITGANDLIATTTEGPAVGQQLPGSQDALQSTIDLASAVLNNSNAIQAQIDAAIVSLNNAIEAFNAAVVEEIDPENLVGHWKFDDASGTTVADASGNSLTGTFGAETMLDAAAGVLRPIWCGPLVPSRVLI